jgi:hypothetical protein
VVSTAYSQEHLGVADRHDGTPLRGSAELLALFLFVAAPWALGYLSASYWEALVPAASLVAAVANYASHPPQGRDEVDVLPGLWVALSAVAVLGLS